MRRRPPDEESDFQEFVAARARGLYRSAYMLAAGDAHLAEDLVQETLTRIFVHWRKVHAADDPVAYAHTVLTRVFLSLRRRRSSSERPSAAALPDTADHGPDPALRLVLLDALAQLPPRDRAVLVLRYWEDRSIEETATALKLSSSAVRSQGTRALARIRAQLGDSLADLAPR